MLNGECCRNHHEIGNGLSIFFCLHLSADLWLVGCCLLYSGCSIPVPMLLFRECCSRHRIQPVDSIVLQLRVESLDRLQTWLADRRTGVHNMVHGLRVFTSVSPTCTWKLCMCGNGLTVTMNNEVGQSLAVKRWSPQLLRMKNEVGQSLAVVRWGPQLLHCWLLKLIASPLSTLEFMSTGDESNQMWCRDESHWDGWVKTSAWTGQSWQLSICTTSCLQLTSDAGLEGNVSQHWKPLSLWRMQTVEVHQ